MNGNRLESIESARRIVVKVGSAVLTDERGLNLRVVNRLADQLGMLHDRGLDIVLVSSGAVAAGKHRIQRFHDFIGDISATDLPARQAASAIGQSRLMHEYDEAFARYDKVSAQVLLTRGDLRSRQRFLNARNTLCRLLDWRVIPIINENDTVAVQELEFGDNDTLASLAVALVDADLFINLTSADGVFEQNPDEHPDARPLSLIEDIENLDIETMCSGKSSAGRGGMYSKLRAARRSAQLGVPTLIVSGKRRFVLEKVFCGENIGTWINAEEKTVSGRKFWLAYHTDPAGDVVVDSGAACALSRGGHSLLPIGIIDVRREFDRGALIRILAEDGEPLGVGLSNYSSRELTRIMGRKCCELPELIGSAQFQEAVHRDNMLLDAAL